jgi:radical SAM-linked protein
VRLFERAAARAGLPVAYSSGFNPRPKISLPFPRSLGIASEAERLLIELQEGLDPDTLTERLAAQMPQGLTIDSSRPLASGEKSLPKWARYRVEWPESTPEELQAAARHFLDSESVLIERRHNKTGAVRHVDLRLFVDTIEVGPGWVDLLLHITPDGTAKPSEICKAIGFDGESINHRICRLEVQWQ